MSQKETQRKPDTQIDEENDFYLSFINKKLRNVRKKLADIDDLSKREPISLKPEQIEKIKSRAEVVQNMKYFEELKDVYYSAYKAAGKDAKPTQKESSIEKTSQSEQVSVRKGSEKSGQEDIVNQQAVKDEIVKETVKKVLDFVSVAQIFGNSANREELLNTSEGRDYTSGVESIQELYKLVFDFVSSQSVKVEEKVSQAADKLSLLVKGEEQVAVGDRTYKAIQSDVEAIAGAEFFRNFKKDNIQQKAETQPKEVVREVQREEPAHLLTTAAVLKPDVDDFAKSPEKGRFLPKEPKVVRFVDEIERDMQNNNTRQGGQDSSNHSSTEEKVQVAKESREPVAHESEEFGQETQEQKSFRKNRSSNGYNNNRQRSNEYNNSNGAQSNKSYRNSQSGHKRYGNDGQRNYGRNGHDAENSYQGKGNGSRHQYREYVQKRPSGDQV